MASLSLEAEYLTPAEAAMVADVPVRDVNRVFDEHLLPDEVYATNKVRRLRADACPLINFYFHTADSLTSEFRSHLIDVVFKREDYEKSLEYLVLVEFKKTASDRLRITQEVLSEFRNLSIEENVVTLNFDIFIEETMKRYCALLEARNLVVEDPDILGGTPVIRDTRIPVYDVAASVTKGIPKERIRSAYSLLDDRMIDLAKLYADANPPRGRPREIPLPMKRKSVRRVPRRAKR